MEQQGVDGNNNVVNLVVVPAAQPELRESQRFEGRRSPMWKEYIKIPAEESPDKKERAMCKHCMKATFVSDTHYGTSNMRKHLRKCMPGIKTETENHIYDQQVYRELVAKAIIKHGYGFSWVEHEGNREIHEYLNNQVKSVCRNTAKSDCLKLHKKLKAQLKDTLHKNSGRISLTADMWTSCQTEGYLCLTAHYVDANWKLNSRVLNFCHIDTPHTGKVMYNAVLSKVQDWGIDDKIFTITLDNASSNDKMQDYLKATLNGRGALVGDGNFFHVRCAAHVLNLIVKDGLKVIEHIVVKIRDCVKYIKWSEARKNIFRSCVSLARLKEVKALWLDVPTRWNSTYMMLDRAILYRKALTEMSELHSCPSPEEWDMLEQIRDVLEPFNEITELFSGSDYPTSNLYFGNVWKILMLLNELNNSDDELLKAMSIEMKQKFDKYWFNEDEDNYSMLFVFAVILDPRCKLPVLKYCYESLYGNVVATLRIADIKLKLEKLYEDYDTSMSSSTNANTTIPNTTSNNKRKFDYFAVSFCPFN